MPIDSITKKIELLQAYETQKVHALDQVFGNLRAVQAPFIFRPDSAQPKDIENILKELVTIRHMLKRILAAIVEQGKKVDEKKIGDMLDQQISLIYEMDEIALSYRNTDNIEYLNAKYHKLFEAIEKFKTLSKSIGSIRNLKEAKLAA